MRNAQRRRSDSIDRDPLTAAIADRDRGIIAMVRRALRSDAVALAFQPIHSTRPGSPVAYYEGLIRLFDETGRVIPARDFITTVEDQELGRMIDCAALRIGLKTLRANPGIRLAVNMSARSIGYPNWMNILRKFIRLHPDAIDRLILEITESSAMQMPEIVAIFMQDMQEHGITFALDDFGAGHTAFRHFRDFCFDILKIDGQFAQDVHTNADNQVLMQALLSIARHFDMLAVAESVETRADAEWLAAAGVDCLQGYYFAAPSLTPPWKGAARGEAATA